MIRASFNIFLFSLFLLSYGTVDAQQKIMVFEENSSLPIFDVSVSIYGIGIVPDGDSWKKAQHLGGYVPVEQYYTNKKGKISTDIFALADSTWRISFHHDEYISTTLTLSALRRANFKVYLESNANTLDEMVVSASRISEKKKDVIQKIRVLRSKEMEFQNQSSMADLMASSGNVFVQKSQLGGGSPIIRGFETNKVLMVVDGVRMNNAIYRGGHLHNIITLDNSIMDRVEVVFGPGSVMYGSDAIGGVMTFKTKDPVLSHKDTVEVVGNAYARYFSAANGFSSNAHVSVANRRFGSLTSFTLSKFGDLRQGANRADFAGDFGAREWSLWSVGSNDMIIENPDPDVQLNSGYAQFDLLQKFTFQQNENCTHKLNFQLSNSGNIDRYDRLTESVGNQPKYAEWFYGPAHRLLASYSIELNEKARLYDSQKLTLAYQNIEESRWVRRFLDPELKVRTERLNIATLNYDFSKQIRKHELRYGLDVFYNHVNSSAFSIDVNTIDTTELDTRYPDGGSDMSSLAIYLTDNWELSDKVIFNGGIRASHVRLNAQFDDKTFFPFPFDDIHQRNTSLNGNLGLIYLPNKTMRYTFSLATGFRAPNVDDVSKVFESVPGKVVVPNPNLKPEYSYNAEFGSEFRLFDKVNLAANVYGTFLSNALTVQNAQFNGQDYVLYDGAYSSVITTTNASRAFVWGFEGVLSGTVGKSFYIYSTMNYTYGRILTDSIPYPLDHIPPIYGKSSVRYQWKRLFTEFFIEYSGWKRIEDYNLVGEDNYAFALPEGMPSWYTLNLRFHYYFRKGLSIQLACENILDQNYRKFASNISAPGRNFIITLRGKF